MLRPAYPLETDRLLLRPYRDEDLDALHEIERLEGTARYLYNAPLDLDATRALLERRKALTAIDEEHDGVLLAAVLCVVAAAISVRVARSPGPAEPTPA